MDILIEISYDRLQAPILSSVEERRFRVMQVIRVPIHWCCIVVIMLPDSPSAITIMVAGPNLLQPQPTFALQRSAIKALATLFIPIPLHLC